MKLLQNDRFIQRIAWGLVSIGGLVFSIFMVRLICAGYKFWGNLNVAETGEVGDFVGGFMGTFISAAGFIFLYLTLKSQNEALDNQKGNFEKEKIESRFFELLQLHRANVAELSFRDWKTGKEISNGRKVFKDIYNQLNFAIKICTYTIKEIRIENILRSESFIDQFTDDQKIKKELIIANLSYDLVFFGVATESLEGLKNVLMKDFKEIFVNDFIEFMSLVPTPESKFWRLWLDFFNDNAFQSSITTHFTQPKDPNIIYAYNIDEFKRNMESEKFYKYFGGHQSKLGHYYRHLFRTVDYIDSKNLPYFEKIEYTRILRAQLSNYEQFLLFFNSVCFVGREWELNYRYTPTLQRISKFDMIRNIPYTVYKYSIEKNDYYIDLKNFYPLVSYEFEKIPVGKEEFIKAVDI